VICPDCRACPLWENAQNVGIGGRGAVHPEFLIVGQNPGSQEDWEGRAFIGPSGKLLTAMLRDAGYDLKSVRVTNAVRCLTPKNRPPEPKEIEACRQHLIAEIQECKPSVIIALGDIALRALCRTSGMRDKRGKNFPLHESMHYTCSVYPMYHPAYILRYPQARATVVADLRKVRDRTITEETVQWEWYKPERTDKVYAVDIETDFDWETKTGGENIVQVAVASSTDGCLVSRAEWPTLMAEVSKGQVVGHNSWWFDCQKVRAAGVHMPWGRDTLVLAYLMDETQPLGLEALSVKYLGVKGWKDEGHNNAKDPVKFALYNARDACYTLRLHDYFLANLGANRAGVPRVRISDEILLPAKLALDECTRRGNFVNLAAVEETEARCLAIADEKVKQLREIADDGAYAEANLWNFEKTRNLNPNSPLEVGRWMELHGMFLPRTQTGVPQTDKAALSLYRGNPFVDALEEYRAAGKQLSTYVKPYKAAAQNADGRIHPEYTIVRTVVGRTSCKSPNLQNLPRELKNFISAPPGKVLVSADYSALHIRLFAWVAQEPRMLAEYAKDPHWDPHLFFAKSFYAKDEISKQERQIAKSANFSQLYLGTGETLQDYASKVGLKLDLGLCHQTHLGWHGVFIGAKPFYGRVERELREKGYVETAVGRRRHFGDVSLMNRQSFNAALREAVNFHVLGLEPDIALPGLSACHKAGLPVCGFIHDSVLLEFDSEKEYLENKGLIAQCMCEAPVLLLKERFGVDMNVPLVIEFEVKK